MEQPGLRNRWWYGKWSAGQAAKGPAARGKTREEQTIMSTLFRDRSDAGRQLAQKLECWAKAKPIVLALPRGGVPVAIEIAQALNAPLDLLLVRKIGVPWQPELALGAVVDGETPHTFVNKGIARAAHISEAQIAVAAKRELQEIERRRLLWLGARHQMRIACRTVIVVDDGVATGASIRVALKAARAARASRVILAAPVAPAGTADELRADCDEAVFVATPENFSAVGSYYEDFRQLEDAEVKELLEHAHSKAA
jgi:putative phosphoribosyl transferase